MKDQLGDRIKKYENVSRYFRLFCQAINAFKNPLTVYDLDAMIYNYWC